jgi:hypothetical protein
MHVLYIGVKNKLCAVYSKYQKKKTVSVHKCWKNWNGTCAFMESNIILEGFKKSIEMHNLKYDSTVYKKRFKTARFQFFHTNN